MGKSIEFDPDPEIKIWEARRCRLSRLEPKGTYVRLGGEVFQVRGRIDNKKSKASIVSLVHVLTNKHFLGGNYGEFAYAIKQGRVELLNEMEVLAWVS